MPGCLITIDLKIASWEAVDWNNQVSKCRPGSQRLRVKRVSTEPTYLLIYQIQNVRSVPEAEVNLGILNVC